MKITVRTLSTKNIVLDMGSNERILKVKKMIYAYIGVPPIVQILIFKGKEKY